MFLDHENQIQYAQERHRELVREAAIHNLLRVKRPLAMHWRLISGLGSTMVRVGQQLQAARPTSTPIFTNNSNQLAELRRL